MSARLRLLCTSCLHTADPPAQPSIGCTSGLGFYPCLFTARSGGGDVSSRLQALDVGAHAAIASYRGLHQPKHSCVGQQPADGASARRLGRGRQPARPAVARRQRKQPQRGAPFGLGPQQLFHAAHQPQPRQQHVVRRSADRLGQRGTLPPPCNSWKCSTISCQVCATSPASRVAVIAGCVLLAAEHCFH